MMITRHNIITETVSAEDDLLGKPVRLVLESTGATIHPGTVTAVTPGVHVPTITVTVAGSSSFAGKSVDVCGDLFNNLINSNFIRMDVL